jgi:peroxiredoxin
MRIRSTIPWLTATLLVIAAAGSWYWYAGRAPDITFSIIDGRRIRLEELRGRPVMIRFWATTCSVCRKELPQLTALYDDLHLQGLALIAVAMPYDPPNRVLETAHRREIPYPVALDVMGKATAAFGDVSLTPTTILVAPDGRIAARYIGAVDFHKLRQQIETMLSQQQQATGNKPLVAGS